MNRPVLRIAIVVAIAAALGACKPPPPPDPGNVAITINKSLPKTYADQLVMQHAHAEGKRLVVDIRIPFATAAQMDPKKLPLIRNQEQGDINIAVCNDPALEALMDSHYQVSHRFLDRDGKTVFEVVAMKAPNCKLLR